MQEKLDDDLNRIPEELGWTCLDSSIEEILHNELKIELGPEHSLFDIPVIVVARNKGSDDILCKHMNQPLRYMVIHLTWLAKQETNPFPTVYFDGNFEEFINYAKNRA